MAYVSIEADEVRLWCPYTEGLLTTVAEDGRGSGGSAVPMYASRHLYAAHALRTDHCTVKLSLGLSRGSLHTLLVVDIVREVRPLTTIVTAHDLTSRAQATSPTVPRSQEGSGQ